MLSNFLAALLLVNCLRIWCFEIFFKHLRTSRGCNYFCVNSQCYNSFQHFISDQ